MLLDEGTRSHQGLVQAKYVRLPLSPRRRSKVCPGELRKEASTKSHANLGLKSWGERQLKCSVRSNNSTRLRLPHSKLD